MGTTESSKAGKTEAGATARHDESKAAKAKRDGKAKHESKRAKDKHVAKEKRDETQARGQTSRSEAVKPERGGAASTAESGDDADDRKQKKKSKKKKSHSFKMPHMPAVPAKDGPSLGFLASVPDFLELDVARKDLVFDKASGIYFVFVPPGAAEPPNAQPAAKTARSADAHQHAQRKSETAAAGAEVNTSASAKLAKKAANAGSVDTASTKATTKPAAADDALPAAKQGVSVARVSESSPPSPSKIKDLIASAGKRQDYGGWRSDADAVPDKFGSSPVFYVESSAPLSVLKKRRKESGSGGLASMRSVRLISDENNDGDDNGNDEAHTPRAATDGANNDDSGQHSAKKRKTESADDGNDTAEEGAQGAKPVEVDLVSSSESGGATFTDGFEIVELDQPTLAAELDNARLRAGESAVDADAPQSDDNESDDGTARASGTAAWSEPETYMCPFDGCSQKFASSDLLESHCVQDHS